MSASRWLSNRCSAAASSAAVLPACRASLSDTAFSTAALKRAATWASIRNESRGAAEAAAGACRKNVKNISATDSIAVDGLYVLPACSGRGILRHSRSVQHTYETQSHSEL